jgi:hypothetical protein
MFAKFHLKEILCNNPYYTVGQSTPSFASKLLVLPQHMSIYADRAQPKAAATTI